MSSRISKVRVASAIVMLVGATTVGGAYARTAPMPPERLIAGLFFSYPESPWAREHFAPRVQPHFASAQFTAEHSSQATTARYAPRTQSYGVLTANEYATAQSQTAGESSTALSELPAIPATGRRNHVSVRMEADSVASTADDDWRVTANPLFNLNHAHERGASLTVRRDF